MNIYFSGIAGTGIGPLAEIAIKAGYQVFGSDLKESAISQELKNLGAKIHYGAQDGVFLEEKVQTDGIDWYVYSSAIDAENLELKTAQKLGLRMSKRGEFLSDLIQKRQQTLIAVAGTHGKTTTTAILVWVLKQLGKGVNYSIGSTLAWAKGGDFDPANELFVYEADEYDRNFLYFHPWISIITVEDYDHSDIYHSPRDYHEAFEQFRSQSQNVIEEIEIHPDITLVGEMRRYDASLVLAAMKKIAPEIKSEEVIAAINSFPGVGRRFEEIATNLFSDYAHHPKEIKACIEMARELVAQRQLKGLAVIYGPHQNFRQHEVFAGYKDAFLGVDKLYWLPSFLTREPEHLKVLKAEDFLRILSNKEIATAAKLDDTLKKQVENLLEAKYLVVLMSAGPADGWLRRNFIN